MGNKPMNPMIDVSVFGQSFIQQQLQKKHAACVKAVVEYVAATPHAYNQQAINQEINALLQTNAIPIFKRAFQRLEQQKKPQQIKLFFDKDDQSTYCMIDVQSTVPIITFVYAAECILSRKQCLRVIGAAFEYIQSSNPSNANAMCTLRMHTPIQLNVLVACAALGIFLKVQSQSKDEVLFVCMQNWPVIDALQTTIQQIDPEQLQFRCIFDAVETQFYQSRFCTERLQFEWQVRTSQRYKELKYLIQNEMLQLQSIDDALIMELEQLPYEQQLFTAYVTYKHENIPVWFVGSCRDVLTKYKFLSNGSKGKKQLQEGYMHIFPLMRERLCMTATQRLNDIFSFSNELGSNHTDVPMDLRVTDLMKSSEVMIRNVYKYTEPQTLDTVLDGVKWTSNARENASLLLERIQDFITKKIENQ